MQVKATAPKSYIARPSTGIIKPNSSAEIEIYLHPRHIDVTRDEFLIMLMDIGDDQVSVAQLKDLWRTSPKEPSKYMEHRCVAGVVC